MPIIFLLLPADYFDHGKTICLFTNLTGYNCYGCGITRAIQHAIHFEFQEALSYNKLVVVVLPLICIGIGIELYNIVKKTMKK